MTDAAREQALPAAPPKEDPETLVLRGSPRPVVRFRRGLIIGITGAVAASLVALAWLALEPSGFKIAAGEEGAQPLRSAPPEALAAAPASYGDVPRLGPPLPGDLGRPILEHQRSLAAPDAVEAPADPGAVVTDTGAGEAEQARAAALAERQRLQAARQAARASGVIVPLAGRGGAGGQVPAVPDGSAVAAVPATGAEPQQERAGPAGPGGADTSPERLRPAPSPWTLSAGTIIPASLITGLSSDLSGPVFAQITEHVRDSATGRTILVPQGARLIGRYDSVVAYGQRRALVVWQRMVFPDGSSIRLDSMPATDLSGYAGLEDEVDFHTWRLLKGIGLSTLLGVGTELGLGSGESDLVRAVRESTQQNAARAGDQITHRNLDVQPTIRVRPGWPLRAVIHQDLVLRPWRG
jgi:type IV secretion system protein VirB10